MGGWWARADKASSAPAKSGRRGALGHIRTIDGGASGLGRRGGSGRKRCMSSILAAAAAAGVEERSEEEDFGCVQLDPHVGRVG